MNGIVRVSCLSYGKYSLYIEASFVPRDIHAEVSCVASITFSAASVRVLENVTRRKKVSQSISQLNIRRHRSHLSHLELRVSLITLTKDSSISRLTCTKANIT